MKRVSKSRAYLRRIFLFALLFMVITVSGCSRSAENRGGGELQTGSNSGTGDSGMTAAAAADDADAAVRTGGGDADATYTVVSGIGGSGETGAEAEAAGTEAGADSGDAQDSGQESRAEIYSRAMARKSQVYDPSKSELISTDSEQRAEETGDARTDGKAEESGEARTSQEQQGDSAEAAERSWTVMVYMIGSNLESVGGNATRDLEEMEAAGLDYSRTNLIVYTGGAQRWTGDIPCDQNSVLDMSEPGEDRIRARTDGNADMGAPDTLAAFVNYCTEQYPADHYAIIFWDHGGGPVLGYGEDELFDNDSLLLSEMDEAMAGTSFGGRGGLRLDFVGFDACLMGSLESMAVWKDYADYYVASSETEPGAGWDYSFLGMLNDTTDVKEITAGIVDSYSAYYEQNKSASSNPDVTLSCTDLSKIDSVLKALGSLSEQLTESLDAGGYSGIQQLRSRVKSFGNLAGGEGKGSLQYDLVDVKDFAEKFSRDYPEECGRLSEAADLAVVRNYSNIDDVCGLTLYYPFGNKDLYRGIRSGLGSILPSSDYRSFISDLSGTWMAADHDRGWKLDNKVQEDGENYLLKLTEEQQENLAGAYYTVFWKDDSGRYMPLLEDISVTPDKDGVIKIPRDPEIICMTMDTEENGVPWGFSQTSSDRKRKVYASHTTGLYKSVEIGSYGENTDPRFVNIYLSEDVSGNTRAGDLSILNVSSVNDDGTAASGDSIDVAGYSLLYNVGYSRYVRKDREGETRAYRDWSGDEMSWIFYYGITGVPAFYKVRASETGSLYAVQAVLEDTSGDEYGTEILELESNEEGASAAYATPSGTLLARVYSDRAVVTGYEGTDTELEIPPEIEGKPVTKIESLSGNDTVKRLSFPGSVTEIESRACEYMNSLEEISLPEGLRRIGSAAFRECGALGELTLPDGLESIGVSALRGCGSLKSVSLPQTCTDVGTGAFCDCTSLQKIELRGENPAYTERDGAVLTADGKTLVAYPQAAASEVSVPDGVETIGYGAFYGAHGLRRVTFPDSLRSIDYGAFYDCTGLEDIAFPENLTRIDEQAFGLSPLSSQDDEYKVQAGKREAADIYIGKNLQEIGEGAFDSFLARRFTVDEENPYFSETEGALMNKAGDEVVAPATDGTGVVVIPDGTVTFRWDLMDLCDSFTADTERDSYRSSLDTYSAVVPDSVTRFESADSYSQTDKVIFHCSRDSAAWKYAEDNEIRHDDVLELDYETVEEETDQGTLTYRVYSDHAQLASYKGADTALAIPDAVQGVPVTVIGDASSDDGIWKDEDNWYNDTLTEMQLPSGLREITDFALDKFHALSDMELPDSLTVIGEEALPHRYDLRQLPLHIENLGRNFASSDLSGELKIPSSIKSIAPGAFESVSGITGFSMEGDNDFYSVTDGILLTADGTELVCYPGGGPGDAVIPEGITRIGDRAFEYAQISSVTFSASVTEIGEYAFDGDRSLERVNFNEGLLEIGKFAFDSCSDLEDITIPGTVTQIHEYAFSDCGIRSLTVPGSVKSVGACAFEGNDNLSELILEEGVRTIGYRAFADNSSLSSVTLPDSLYAVDRDAFSGGYSPDTNGNTASASGSSLSDGGEDISAAGSSGLPGGKGDSSEAGNSTLPGEGAASEQEGTGRFVLKIGAGLTEIGSNAFGGLPLSAFLVSGDNQSYTDVGGLLTDVSGEVLTECPAGLSGTVAVPDGITRIESGAFEGCKKVTDVIIPDSVTAFGYGVFPTARDPDADPDDYSARYVGTVTIHCSRGSAACEYAAEYNIPYVTDQGDE